jgi:hypothetical protein
MATETSVVSLDELHWPLPPPSPPDLPPVPPPERGLNATTDQLECQFEQGIDLSVSRSEEQQRASDSGGTHSAHAVDSKTQCCALCAMKNGCSRFVYIPGSSACALLPQVHKTELVRISNPATVAGTVFVAHGNKQDQAARRHTSCIFDVGYGYSQGALGAGRPLDEPQITSQQACCDACERHPECAKFVFEKFGGTCQLYESFSERYRTPGLIAGSIPARLAMGYQAVANMLAASDDGGTTISSSSQNGAQNVAPHPPFVMPPFPPSFAQMVSYPPPSPPMDAAGTAEAVLAYGSLAVSILLGLTMLLFTYCFYFGEIQGLMHRWTRGRFGKPQFSLLPKALQDIEHAADTDHMDRPKRAKGKGKESKMLKGPKGAPSPGHVSVTCVTEHVTQKKSIDLSECASMGEARRLLWDAFGHLLKNTPDGKIVVLCLAPNPMGGESEVDAGGAIGGYHGDWKMLTAASDMQRAIACPTWKMAERAIISPHGESFPLAFASEKDEAKAAHKAQQQRIALEGTHLPHRTAQPAAPIVNVEVDPAEAGRGTMDAGDAGVDEDKDGGETDDDEEDRDANSEASEQQLEPISTFGRRTTLGIGWSDEQPGAQRAGPSTDEVDPTDLIGLRVMTAGRDQRAALRSAAAAEADLLDGLMPDEAAIAGIAEPRRPSADAHAGVSAVGTRVEIYGLKSTAHLNGRIGSVVKLDGVKGRVRVRLDALPGKWGLEGKPPQTLAFKPENLMRTRYEQ